MSTIDVLEESLPVLDARSETFLRSPHEVLHGLMTQGPLARSHRGIEVLSLDLCTAILNDFDNRAWMMNA